MSHAVGRVYLAACDPGVGDASAQFNALMPRPYRGLAQYGAMGPT
jgi:hypothetical protein